MCVRERHGEPYVEGKAGMQTRVKGNITRSRRGRLMTQRTNIQKLKKIKSIITDFNAALVERPYRNKIDQARTAAMMSEILNVFWKEIEEQKAQPRKEIYIPPPPPVIDPSIQKELNMEELQKIRNRKSTE